ncbi:type II toxin-antitoxin system CcdA family antitoxin [Candidatus Binatia bacterium]|nr:type II toxin-antitoxin system CcdA family antitoxin [Candidatus Binatia bacterium]
MKSARKIATNVSAKAEIVREAKALGLNLSAVFEAAVAEAVRRKRRDAWLEENRDAIESYNDLVVRDGLFSDGWRKF